MSEEVNLLMFVLTRRFVMGTQHQWMFYGLERLWLRFL